MHALFKCFKLLYKSTEMSETWHSFDYLMKAIAYCLLLSNYSIIISSLYYRLLRFYRVPIFEHDIRLSLYPMFQTYWKLIINFALNS